jgi:hypothetical protein
MRLLYIDEVLVDLTDNVIALTKQTNDLFDFNNKRASLSNTIELPKTPATNLLFGELNDQATTTVKRNFYDVKYIQNYTEIISKGRGKLLGETETGYKFTIYWGNINLVEILGDKTIKDLDLADLDHIFTLANVTDLSGDLEYCICNPYISEDLPSGGALTNIEASDMIPFVSLRRILEQIQEDNDIVLSGNAIQEFLTTGVNQYIPCQTRRDLSYSLSALNELKLIIDNRLGYAGDTYANILDIAFRIGIVNQNEFEIASDGEYLLNANLRLEFAAQLRTILSQHDLEVEVIVFAEFYDIGTTTWTTYANKAAIDAAIASNELVYNSFTYVGSGEGSLILDQNMNLNRIIDFVNGDKIRFRAYFDWKDMRIGATEEIRYILSHNVGSTFEIGFTNTKFGWTYNIAPNMPAVKQLDIIKYIAACTGSFVDIEDGTNVVRFKKIEDIINDVPNSQDYSDMLIDYKIENVHPDLGIENIMRYRNHATVRSDVGEGVFTLDNNTLPKINEFYLAPFSASSNELWRHSTGVGYDIANLPVMENWVKGFKNINARILMTTPASLDFIFTDGITTDTATSKRIAYFSEPIQGFQSIINSNYSGYISAMDDYKEFAANMDINSEDFKRLDLQIPIFIQRLSAYFLVMKVNNFVEGMKTMFKMIKL